MMREAVRDSGGSDQLDVPSSCVRVAPVGAQSGGEGAARGTLAGSLTTIATVGLGVLLGLGDGAASLALQALQALHLTPSPSPQPRLGQRATEGRTDRRLWSACSFPLPLKICLPRSTGHFPARQAIPRWAASHLGPLPYLFPASCSRASYAENVQLFHSSFAKLSSSSTHRRPRYLVPSRQCVPQESVILRETFSIMMPDTDGTVAAIK